MLIQTIKRILHPRATSPNNLAEKHDLSLSLSLPPNKKKKEGEKKTIVKLNRLGQTVATIFNNRAAYV